MGLVYASVTVATPSAGPCHLDMLVDSGAAFSLLPRRIWQALGLHAQRTLEFILADGIRISRQVSECRFVYEGTEAWSPVILGEEGDEALLGAVTLETLGLVLNPFDRSLHPMRASLAALESLSETLCV
ncbi:MAG: aspartyl protease [Deltaproteobacteria bacterium]|nr:aspartyl protease [Deltaproteobacteria bacterium]